jgi:hypothetical protein
MGDVKIYIHSFSKNARRGETATEFSADGVPRNCDVIWYGGKACRLHVQVTTLPLRSGLAWFKYLVLGNRGVWRGFEKGRRPLCRGKDDVLHAVFKCFGSWK